MMTATIVDDLTDTSSDKIVNVKVKGLPILLQDLWVVWLVAP